MECTNRVRLNAFHDGELSPSAAREVEGHLAHCASCTAELAEIRALSSMFDDFGLEKMSESGLARAHRLLDAPPSDLPVLRVAGLLSGLAASVLVVGTAWLLEAPPAEGRAREVRMVRQPAMAPEWERVAITFQPDPLPVEKPAAPARSMLATADGLDERLAQWMLQNLRR